MATLVKFVDSIAASPTTRLDLNDGTTWTVTALDPGMPRLRRAASANAMTHGIFVSSSTYDARRLTITLVLNAGTADGNGTEVQKLARELDRTDNFLMYQDNAFTKPVFFRTYRSDFSQLQRFIGSTAYQGTVEILAEPFALGLLETLGPFTVNYDPAASNGLYFDATGVIGDVEAQPRVSWPTGASGSTFTFSLRRRGTPSATPFLLQAEAMTLGGDSSISTESNASGGASNNAVNLGTITSSLVQRVSMADYPSSDTVDARGRYRVLARFKHNNATPTTYQLKLGYTSTDNVNPTVTFTATGNAWVSFKDLGYINIPFGADPVASDDGTTLAADGVPLSLRVASTSGSPSCALDYLLFIPADDRLGIVAEGYSSAGGDTVVDGNGLVWARTSGGAVQTPDNPSAMTGGTIALAPNVTNRVFAIPSYAATATITGTVAVTLKYHPRYLFVRPSAS